MKICLMCQEDVVRPQGGTGTYARNVSMVLADCGHDVHVITRQHGKMPSFEQMGGVRVHRVKAPGPPVLYSPLYFRRSARKFWELSRQDRFDVVLGNFPLMSSWGLRGKNMPPVVETLHCTVQEELRSLSHSPLHRLNVNEALARSLGPVWLHRERSLLRRAQRIISVSHALKCELTAQGRCSEEKIAVIPNGIDSRRFAESHHLHHQELRRSLGIPEDARVILYLGRLMERKRAVDLVRALPGVLREVASVHLVVVGRRNQNAELIERETQRRGLRRRVTLVDHVPYGDVPRYYALADVYCLPSSYEGFPFTVLEAMASETPVVASRIKGIDEQIVHGETGQLHGVGDIQDITRCIVRALEDVTFVSRATAAARDVVRHRYDWTVIGARTERVLADATT